MCIEVISWFQPTGCTLSPIDCSNAPGILALLPNTFRPKQPGGYYVELAVWDPAGNEMDCTISSGRGEDTPVPADSDDEEAYEFVKKHFITAKDAVLRVAITDNNWVKHFT
mmetsp:Transcript_5632/g.12301  ORF Transcript_5632/g.12301 Transcript_5632/m.12301 type:complete len:111 (+) Transcript_5632:350-682(+)